ncbi:biotin/lipoyl-binding protein [Oceanidesulfovibrio marinus]|uniref:biotin/lipoyl-binding protein n=1 Tax=Oceanidesulfovibrio marinus TaxID=370038 RepID=UPI001ABFC9A8
MNLHFRVGYLVDKGQLIAAIDDREIQAQLEQTQADLHKANAKAPYTQRTIGLERGL